MYRVQTVFHPEFEPAANPDAVILAGNARFTLLTPRLVRMEYSPFGAFEDRASQAFWYRRQPIPAFAVQEQGNELRVDTDYLQLIYQKGAAFTPETLKIHLKTQDSTYHFGDADPLNLKGTYRTLDTIDGRVELENGLVSRSGWSVYDDSNSLVFDQNGWLERRADPENRLDVYFFGYGHDYLSALQDFQKIAGKTPLLPRWALGNWWSRYYPYSETELKELLNSFKNERIPLSVCIIDMDWHVTQTGNDSSGWTGYTWNRDLFPDPPAFMSWLHENGLKTALNLHPADGIWPHEELYPDVCTAMGQNPEEQQPVPFDIANPLFTQAYFAILHHPMEAAGVDFWWIDWQQGTQSKLAGLDPLYWLNHLHFYDLARGGKKRPFIFSRWGGLGNHRYPIGFSGDTVVTWDSLAFQPYFTATAANVAYGWWSHDIGGHFFGMEDGELFTRWVQFGAFSPILRMHSTRDPYIDHCPWAYDAGTLENSRKALRLHHALIPYIYSMSWRNEREGIPMLLPMYYEHPEKEEAYHFPQQYLFGTELLAAPVTTPANSELGLSKQVVWLPEGDWYDFFTGEYQRGDTVNTRYYRADEIPVFARAGAIVPLAAGEAVNGVANPREMEVVVFPGASRSFDLFEDDGESLAYAQGQYRMTRFEQIWNDNRSEFRIHPAQGTFAEGEPRSYRLTFRGIQAPGSITVQVNGSTIDVASEWQPASSSLRLGPIGVNGTDEVRVTIAAGEESLASRSDWRMAQFRKLLWHGRIPTFVKSRIDASLPELLEDVCILEKFAAALTEAQIQALAETICGVGAHRMANNSDQDRILLWNNQLSAGFGYSLSVLAESWRVTDRLEADPVPRFKVIRVEQDCGVEPYIFWRLKLNYFGLTHKVYEQRKVFSRPEL